MKTEDPKAFDRRWYGRLRSVDRRDRKHTLQPNLRKAARITRQYWYVPKVLNQGSTPQCVGYSGWNYLAASPVRNNPKFTPSYLYRQAQEYDEWPGSNYDGSSVRGLFKYLNKAGFVSEYLWAFDSETVVAHVLTVGPVVMGTDWLADMDEPRQGYLWPRGENYGGHAWLIVGADRKRSNPDGTKGAVRMLNSWGKSWGENGRAWVSFDSLHTLIKRQGEACVAVEVTA